jgi:hypothetical protein
MNRRPRPMVSPESLDLNTDSELWTARRQNLWGLFRQSLVNRPFRQDALENTPVYTQFRRNADTGEWLVTQERKLFLPKNQGPKTQFLREQLRYLPGTDDQFQWRQTRWAFGGRTPWVQQIGGEKRPKHTLVTTTASSATGFTHLAYLAEPDGPHKLYVHRHGYTPRRRQEFLTYWLMRANSRQHATNLDPRYFLPKNALPSQERVLMVAPNTTSGEETVSTLLTQTPPSWANMPNLFDLELPPL